MQSLRGPLMHTLDAAAAPSYFSKTKCSLHAYAMDSIDFVLPADVVVCPSRISSKTKCSWHACEMGISMILLFLQMRSDVHQY
jgi:hypothetical protein